MARGESPFECAARETAEETGLAPAPAELRLFGYVSEKNYEGGGHWLMFLFDCLRPLPGLPSEALAQEGKFAFFTRAAIDRLRVPPSDRFLVWPYYDRHRRGFAALRADCQPGRPLVVVEEQILPAPPRRRSRR
jgi:8-oxo-dGTP diphosphatase